jgi:hypothetical protein
MIFFVMDIFFFKYCDGNVKLRNVVFYAQQKIVINQNSSNKFIMIR